MWLASADAVWLACGLLLRARWGLHVACFCVRGVEAKLIMAADSRQARLALTACCCPAVSWCFGGVCRRWFDAAAFVLMDVERLLSLFPF